jgi:hypothetical protein
MLAERAALALLALVSGACGSKSALVVRQTEPPEDAGVPDSPEPSIESCNAVDDDGDGAVDETCTCRVGDARVCAPEPPAGVDVCAPGAQHCLGSGWTACLGTVLCTFMEERFVYSDAVDVILVVDQSASMSDEIDSVRANVGRFADAVAASERSYRLILIASRSGERALCIEPPLAGPACADSDRFHQIDEEVGSGNSLDLVQSHLAEIESFAESHSQRTIVVVSDDDMRANPFDFHLAFRATPEWHDYVFHAVAGVRGSTCRIARPALAYEVLASMTGGELLDICAPDWGRTFDRIADDVARRPRTFALAREPLPGTLEVLAGEPPAVLPSDRWRYDRALHGIVIERDDALPPGTPLVVRYYAEWSP